MFFFININSIFSLRNYLLFENYENIACFSLVKIVKKTF